EDLPVVVERLLRHEHVDDVHVLTHPREWLLEWDAVEVLDDVWTGGPEAHHHSSAREVVERGEVLRYRPRRAREDVDDAGTQLNVRGLSGQDREDREGIPPPGL